MAAQNRPTQDLCSLRASATCITGPEEPWVRALDSNLLPRPPPRRRRVVPDDLEVPEMTIGDATDTPKRPAAPTTEVWRTGGGYQYRRSERFTEAMQLCAAYDTYRTLPFHAEAHTATDVAVLAEILRVAEEELDAVDGRAGVVQQQASLSQVLRAYQRVLQATGVEPDSDTRYYRTLLRLSLDREEADWWGRLYREISGNCRRYGASPEQQQMLMNVLLRCRVCGSPAREECSDAAVAEWAQAVVKASRTASAVASAHPAPAGPGGDAAAPMHCGMAIVGHHGLHGSRQPRQTPDPGGAAAATASPSDHHTAVGWDALETPSFVSLPPGSAAEAGQRDEAAQLEAAVLTWQQASSAARVVDGNRASGSQQSKEAPVEDALCSSWQEAPGPQRPESAGAASSMAVCFVVPPPSLPPPPQEHWQPAYASPAAEPVPFPAAAFAWGSPVCVTGVPAWSLTGQQEPLPPRQQQDGTSPVRRAQPPGPCSSTKYPQIYSCCPPRPAAADPGNDSPVSPRILAYLEPSSSLTVLGPAAIARPVLAAAAAQPTTQHAAVPGHERQELLLGCWGEWRSLARAALGHWSAAHSAAAFHGWRQGTQRAKQLHSKASAVVARWQQLQLNSALAAWREAHALQLGRMQVLWACVVRLRQGSAARALAAWRTVVARRAELRDVGQHCIHRLAQLSLSRAYHQWKAYAATMATRQAQVEAFRSIRTTHIVHERLAAWRAVVGEEVRMRTIVAHLCHGTAVRALQHWQVMTQERARLRERMLLVAGHMGHRTAAKALSRWRSWREKRQGKTAKLQAAVAAWRSSCLRAAFSRWRQHVTDKCQQRTHLQHAVQSLLHFRLRAAWQGWQGFVGARREAAGRLLKAVQLWQQMHLLKAFRSWQERHATWQERRLKISLAVTRWQAGSISAAWQAWASFVAARLSKKVLLASAVARLLNVRATAVFAALRECAAARRRRGAQLEAAVWHWWNARLAAAFVTWREHAAARKGLRARLRHAVARLTNRCLVSAFASWRAVVETRRSVRSRLEGCVGRLRGRALFAAFSSWLEFASKRQALRAKLDHVLAHWRQAALTQAWRAWRAAALAQQAQVAELLAASKRWHQPLLSQAFQAWAQHIEMQRQAAGQLERAMAHWLHASLVSAFITWRYQVWKARAVHQAAVFFSNQAIAKAFQSWRTRCSRRKELAHRMEGVVAHWVTWQTAAAFRAWREASQRRRYQHRVVAAASARLRNRDLWLSFRGWQAVAREQRQKGCQLVLAIERWREMTLRMAWDGWRQSLLLQKLQKQQLAAAVALWQNSRLRAAWAPWREAVAIQAQKRERLGVAVALWQRSQLRVAWAAWLAFLTFRRHGRAVAHRFMHRGVARAFASWRASASLRARLSASLAVAVQRWQHNTLASAIAAWREALATRQRRNQQLGLAVGCWMRSTLASAFSAWRSGAEEQQGQRLALALFTRTTLCKGWATWCCYVEEHHQEQLQLRRAVDWWLHGTLATVFAQWFAFVQRRQAKAAADVHHHRHLLASALAALKHQMELRLVAEACLRRLLNRHLAAAFSAWQQHLAGSRQLAANAEERHRGVVLRMRNRLLACAWASWRQHAKRNQRLRQVLLRFQRCHLLAALLLWRDRTARMQHACHLMRRRLMSMQQWAFVAWRDAAVEAAEERWALDQVVEAEGRGLPSPKKLVFELQGQHELALAMHAFGRWRGVAAAQRHHRAAILRAYKHLYYALARRCFAILRFHTLKQRQLRDAVAIFKQSCQRLAWLSWREHFQHIQARSAQLQRAVSFWAGNAEAQAWYSWRAFAVAAKRHRAACAAAAQHYRWQLQRRALLTLFVCLARRREQHALDYQAVGHMQGFRLMLLFCAWRRTASQHVRLRWAARQLASKTSMGRAQRIIMLWRWWAARQRYLRQVASSFEQRRMCWCLWAWLEAAHLSACLRSRAQVAAIWWSSRAVIQVFAAWRIQAPLLKRCRVLLGAAAARLQHRGLLSAWNAWRLTAGARQRLKSRAVAVVQRMQHLKLSSAMAAWEDAVAVAATKRQLLRRAVELFVGSAQRQAFNTWRSRVAESSAEAAAIEQHDRLLLLRAYYGWSDAMQQRRCLRFRAQAVVRQMMQRGLARSFRSWRAHAEQGAEMRLQAALLVGALQQRLVRAAFSAWADRMRHKAVATQLMQRVLCDRAEKSLGACFAAYRVVAAESRHHQQLLQLVLGRLTHRHLSQTWRHWHEAAAFSRHSRELVSGAVKKLVCQRMAACFTWWRQWAGQKCRLAGIQLEAVCLRQHHQLATCISTWHATAHRAATARRALAAMRLRLVHQAFFTLQAAVENSRAEAAAAQLAPLVLRRTFAWWRATLALSQLKRERLGKAAALAFGSSKQRAWKAWSLHHVQQHKKHAAEQRFQAGLLRRCLLSWQERVAMRQRLLVKQQHLQQRAARCRLAEALQEWRRLAKAVAFLWCYCCVRALAAWRENAATALAKRQALRRAVNLLSNSLLARSFVAWRSETTCMATKRAAFARKQQAVREAVRIGDAIIRQRRRQLVTAALAAWREQARVSQLVQERMAQCLQGSMHAAFTRWMAFHQRQAGKRMQAELSRQHHSAAVQLCALVAWQAGLAAAAQERKQKYALADAFASNQVLLRAWQGWAEWMALQEVQHQRLVGLLSTLGGASSTRGAVLPRCWQRWTLAVDGGRRRADRAREMAARRVAVLLQDVFSMWNSYARAMHADLDPSSPFASPRAPEANRELIWSVARLVAGRSGSADGNNGSIERSTSTEMAGQVAAGEVAVQLAVPTSELSGQKGGTSIMGASIPSRWMLRERRLGSYSTRGQSPPPPRRGPLNRGAAVL